MKTVRLYLFAAFIMSAVSMLISPAHGEEFQRLEK